MLTLFIVRTGSEEADCIKTASSFGNNVHRWYQIENPLFINGFYIETEWYALMYDYEAIEKSLSEVLGVFMSQNVDLLVAHNSLLFFLTLTQLSLSTTLTTTAAT